MNCITNTTSNPKLNIPCKPNASFIIAFLDYMNDTGNYHWRTAFENLDMEQILEITSDCKNDHPDVKTITASADKILGVIAA